MTAVMACRTRRIPYVIFSETHGRSPRPAWLRLTKRALLRPIVAGAAAWLATGSLSVEPDQRRAFLDGVFLAGRCDDTQTLATMSATFAATGQLIDPHTAVAVGAVQPLLGELATVVTMATAHPAKFPDAVEQATGIRPPLPPHLADLFDRPERLTRLPNNLSAVQRFVAALR